MSAASIRRRLGALEFVVGPSLFPDYAPLTAGEVEAIAERVRMRKQLTAIELHRLQRQSPIVSGELLISAYRGNVSVKRYSGVDLSEV